MRPTSGIALGFDRLVMLLTGAETIDQVRPQAWDPPPPASDPRHVATPRGAQTPRSKRGRAP